MKQDKKSIDCICEHHWISHGKTSYGKQRYKCTKCGITRVAKDEKTLRKIIDTQLKILVSGVSMDSHIWQEALDFNSLTQEYEPNADYKYDIVEKMITWRQFQRAVRYNKLLPLAVYCVSESSMDKNAQFCAFKVVANEKNK